MKDAGDEAPGPGRAGLSSSVATRSGPGLLPATLLCSLFLRDLLDALEQSPANIGSGAALPLCWITFCGVFGKLGRLGPIKNLEAFSDDRWSSSWNVYLDSICNATAVACPRTRVLKPPATEASRSSPLAPAAT